MGNVKSKRTLDISSTPKKEAIVVKVRRTTIIRHTGTSPVKSVILPVNVVATSTLTATVTQARSDLIN